MHLPASLKAKILIKIGICKLMKSVLWYKRNGERGIMRGIGFMLQYVLPLLSESSAKKILNIDVKGWY